MIKCKSPGCPNPATENGYCDAYIRPPLTHRVGCVCVACEAAAARGFAKISRGTPATDDINPDYYIEGRDHEPRIVIADWGLNYNAGCVVKYIARYQRKGNPLKDLRKAKRYLEFEIERLVGEGE